MIDRAHVRIHPTAEVADSAEIGAGTSIWNRCQIREDARIGAGCILGSNVYIDFGVRIGDNVKIQNNSLLYHGLTLESGVFVGPGVIFTNDRLPRAINPDGSLKRDADWEVGLIRVEYGAAVGAGAIVLPGVTVGRFALVAAGALVTRNVAPHALMVGSPARPAGYVCACAARLVAGAGGVYTCARCGEVYRL